MNFIKSWFAKYLINKKAKRKYRVVQTSKHNYEIQVYENIGLNGRDVWIYQPLVVAELKNSKFLGDYIDMCDYLRSNYQDKLIKEYEAEYENNAYPKVIY